MIKFSFFHDLLVHFFACPKKPFVFAQDKPSQRKDTSSMCFLAKAKNRIIIPKIFPRFQDFLTDSNSTLRRRFKSAAFNRSELFP